MRQVVILSGYRSPVLARARNADHDNQSITAIAQRLYNNSFSFFFHFVTKDVSSFVMKYFKLPLTQF